MSPLEQIEAALAEIEAREKAATKGDWVWYSGGPSKRDLYALTSKGRGSCLARDVYNKDADFITHARTDVPKLIAALRVAIRQRNGYRENYWAVTKPYEGSKEVVLEDNDIEIAKALTGEEK